MKILKQNDDATGLIFKQNVNGKVMKQNYTFGRYLSSNTISSAYLSVDRYWKDISVLIWAKAEGGNSLNEQLSDSPTLGCVANQKKLYAGGGVWCYMDPVKGTYYSDKGLYYCSGIDNILKVDAYYQAYGTPFSGMPTTQKISLKVSLYMGIHRMCIFNRSLTKDEVVYVFNNGLGNDLLNTYGLVADFNFATQQFEPVVVNSVEYPGIIDRISGMHAYLSPMPAGTTSEKVNYANSNFFKTW